MDAKTAARVLSLHNDYRRGFTNTAQSPANVGQAIDLAVAVLLASSSQYRIDGPIVTVALPPPQKGTRP